MKNITKLVIFFALTIFNWMLTSGQTCDAKLHNAYQEIDLEKLSYNQVISHFKEKLECYKHENKPLDWLRANLELNYFIRIQLGPNESTHFLDSITSYFGSPKNMDEKKLLIWAYIQKGYGNEKINNYYQSYFDYQKSISLLLKDCDNSMYWNCGNINTIATYLVENLCAIFRKIGDYESIIDEITEGFLKEFDKNYTQDIANVLANLYNLKGFAYMNLNDFDLALEHFDDALSVQGIDKEIQAIIYINKGLVFHKRSGSKDSLRSLQQLDLAKFTVNQLNSDSKRNKLSFKVDSLSSKINLYRALFLKDHGAFDNSLSFLNKSLEFTEKGRIRFNSEHYSQLYLMKGQILDSLGKYELAQFFYDKVIELCCYPFKDIEPNLWHYNKCSRLDRNLVDALVGKARFWRGEHLEISGLTKLVYAINAHKLAIQVEDHIRSIYSQEAARQRISASRDDRIGEVLDIANTLWMSNPQSPLVEDILYFIEKNRAQELHGELFLNELSENLGSIPRELETQVQIARFTMMDFARKLDSARNESDTEQTTLDKFNERYEQSTRIFKASNSRLEQALLEIQSNYFVQKSQQPIISLDSLRSSLELKETFISFYDSPSSDYLYALYISKNKSLFKRINLDEEIEDCLLRVKNFIHTPFPLPNQRDTFQDDAHTLYLKLLKPIESWNSQRLIVAPSPLLYDLPLEVLLTKASSAEELPSYNKWNYAWKKYEICYAFSATLFAEKNTGIDTPTMEYLGFAPKYGTERKKNSRKVNSNKVSELYYNSSEVYKSDSIFQQYNAERRTYYGKHADKNRFKNTAELSRILHLALHAFKGDSAESTPFLLFTPDTLDPQSPKITSRNQLFSYEIPTLDLSSELLVLSACYSGIGELVLGEGIKNFARAFRLAGVPNTVMSLWEVDDFAPSEIIPSFFASLKQGKTKTQALNEARAAYLANSSQGNRQKSPYFWAHFVLVGNPDPMYPKANEDKQNFIAEFYQENPVFFWILSVLLVGILSGFIFLKGSQLRKLSS